jgi:uncharacterized protein
MSSPFPELLDPGLAADNRKHFSGHFRLSSLPRLRGLLLDPAGEATFRLAFERDENGRVVVLVQVQADLGLRCQRCLGAVTCRVEVESALAVVASVDESKGLPDRYEPLLIDGVAMRPRDLIEDELLLGLPLIPRHPPGDCGALAEHASVPEAGHGDGRHPFAVLAALKRKH